MATQIKPIQLTVELKNKLKHFAKGRQSDLATLPSLELVLKHGNSPILKTVLGDGVFDADRAEFYFGTMADFENLKNDYEPFYFSVMQNKIQSLLAHLPNYWATQNLIETQQDFDGLAYEVVVNHLAVINAIHLTKAISELNHTPSNLQAYPIFKGLDIPRKSKSNTVIKIISSLKFLDWDTFTDDGSYINDFQQEYINRLGVFFANDFGKKTSDRAKHIHFQLLADVDIFEKEPFLAEFKGYEFNEIDSVLGELATFTDDLLKAVLSKQADKYNDLEKFLHDYFCVHLFLSDDMTQATWDGLVALANKHFKNMELDGYGFVIPYNDFKAVIERLKNL